MKFPKIRVFFLFILSAVFVILLIIGTWMKVTHFTFEHFDANMVIILAAFVGFITGLLIFIAAQQIQKKEK